MIIPPATSPPTLPYLPTLFIHDPTLSSPGASLNKFFSSSLRNLRSPSQPFVRFSSVRFARLLDEVGPRPDRTRISEYCLILFSFFHVMLLLYDVWFYSIVSLIHHLCKRETKRNVEAIVCVLVGCVFCATDVLYCIHDMTWCLHGTGPANSRNTEKSGVPQVSVKCKSGFGLVVLLPCV